MNEQLLDAIAEKDLSRVEELLAAGADPNTRRGDKTAYQLVPHSAYEIKCALIEAGAEDPELKELEQMQLISSRLFLSNFR